MPLQYYVICCASFFVYFADILFAFPAWILPANFSDYFRLCSRSLLHLWTRSYKKVFSVNYATLKSDVSDSTTSCHMTGNSKKMLQF